MDSLARTVAITALAFATWPTLAAATEDGGTWHYSTSATLLHQPEVDLDNGGKTRSGGYHLRAAGRHRTSDAAALGISLYYDYNDRDFTGGGFAAINPWEQTHRLGVSASLNARSRFGWSYSVRPFVQWFSEAGTLDKDAMRYGTAAAVLTGLSRHKRIGAGMRVYRDIDGDTGIAPIVIIDWRLNDRWTLGNPREADFTAPAGLEIRYHDGGNWRFGLAGVYHSEEFRLDEAGAAPGGIGENEGLLSFLRITRQWGSALSVHGYLGAVFAGELQVEDADGVRLAASDHDTAPFAALSLEGRF